MFVYLERAGWGWGAGRETKRGRYRRERERWFEILVKLLLHCLGSKTLKRELVLSWTSMHALTNRFLLWFQRHGGALCDLYCITV